MTGIGTAEDTAAVSSQSNPLLGSITVDRGEQDLSGAPVGRLTRPFHGISVGALLPTADVDLESVVLAFRVDRDDDRLTAVSSGQCRDQLGVRECGGVDADLVGARLDSRVRVVFFPDTAADTQRQKDFAGYGLNGFGERLPLFDRGSDVENHDLVDALAVVAPRQCGRVTGVSEALEVDALDDRPVTHIETRDDAFGQAHETFRRKFRRMRRPTSDDFSGWNWTPPIWSRSTAAANSTPYRVAPTQSAVRGAANECVK